LIQTAWMQKEVLQLPGVSKKVVLEISTTPLGES